LVDQAKIHKMVQIENIEKHKEAVDQLKNNFVSLPNKAQAGDDLIRLTQDDDRYVRWGAASALGSAFRSIPNASKAQAWDDLHRLTQDDDCYVRSGAASALGSAFNSIPAASKAQAWDDLHRLTQDDYSDVRWGLHLIPFPLLPKFRPGMTFTVSLRTMALMCEMKQLLHLALHLIPFPLLPKLRPGMT